MVEPIGITVVIIFYAAIVVVGIIAAKKFKPAEGSTDLDVSIVAGRNLGLVVGCFTMAATFVGGGYINGTAEGVAKSGITWTLTPFGIFIGIIIGGLVYAPIMRRRRYVTMLDPLQERYGDVMTGLLFLGQTFGDLLWAASILAALGTSLSVILQIPTSVGIIVSTLVGVAYTIFGHMVAVAYTDILQMIFMVFGLVLALPFAFTHPAVGDIGKTAGRWLGSIPQQSISPWIDFAIIQVCGSIPWQTYYQRVLSARSVSHARITSIVGAFAALLLGVPPMLIGAISVSTNWNATKLGTDPTTTSDVSKVLPLVLQYLTPKPVAIIGLAAVVAAVMSSLDSIILSSSSMFTQNVYRMSFRRKASQFELMVVQRVSLFIAAAIATVLAIFLKSIFDMFYLAADVVFVIMFPQLTCSLLPIHVNGYGSFVGLFLGLFLRLAGGDPGLGLPALIKYPFYSEKEGQIFPFKTFAMLSALISNLAISALANVVFKYKILPAKFDIAKCLQGPNFKAGLKEEENCALDTQENFNSTDKILHDTKL